MSCFRNVYHETCHENVLESADAEMNMLRASVFACLATLLICGNGVKHTLLSENKESKTERVLTSTCICLVDRFIRVRANSPVKTAREKLKRIMTTTQNRLRFAGYAGSIMFFWKTENLTGAL